MAGFRVLIVGAGIGGLTLANCLQHAGIDYLLLEGREEIGLHVGAGVGLEPNGDRILDQLGVRSDLEAELIANRCFVFRDINGKIMYERDGPSLVRQRYVSPCVSVVSTDTSVLSGRDTSLGFSAAVLSLNRSTAESKKGIKSSSVNESRALPMKSSRLYTVPMDQTTREILLLDLTVSTALFDTRCGDWLSWKSQGVFL